MSGSTAEEIEAARTRLAKANVFNSLDPIIQSNDVEAAEKAAKRIRKVAGYPNGEDGIGHALENLAAIVELLREAELTINFSAERWFVSEIKGANYINVWQLRELRSTPLTEARVDAEEKMFKYTTGTGRLAQDSDDEIGKSIKSLGDAVVDSGRNPTSPTFRSAMRPAYAAVNWGASPFGGAPFYGNSCFVLRPYMKHNATYAHRDSLNGEVSIDTLCSFHHLFKIPLHCDEAVLKAMIKRVEGDLTPFTINSTKYIEAELHSDIMFARDVQHIRIYRPIVEGSDYIKDAKVRKKVKANIEAFAKRNGLTHEYFNS